MVQVDHGPIPIPTLLDPRACPSTAELGNTHGHCDVMLLQPLVAECEPAQKRYLQKLSHKIASNTVHPVHHLLYHCTRRQAPLLKMRKPHLWMLLGRIHLPASSNEYCSTASSKQPLSQCQTGMTVCHSHRVLAQMEASCTSLDPKHSEANECRRFSESRWIAFSLTEAKDQRKWSQHENKAISRGPCPVR